MMGQELNRRGRGSTQKTELKLIAERNEKKAKKGRKIDAPLFSSSFVSFG
jgi:hypothetical protein